MGRRVGVVVNLDKPQAADLARELCGWLSRRGIEPRLPAEVAGLVGLAGLGGPVEEWAAGTEFAVVLGGDGTLLQAARRLSPYGCPLLGVNLGRLGFLTELEGSDLFGALPEVLAGGFQVERRMMLEAVVERTQGAPSRYLALNDAVVTKGPFARMVHLEVYVDETPVASYPADGLIVATPTGSTAYSLSAGGPVINPGLDLLVVTPICPHSFYARSVVVAQEEAVRVKIQPVHPDTMLTIDGQEGCILARGDEVVVRRASEVTRLLRRPGWSFYRVLRRKLTEAYSE
ncbi:MAG: NAD(+)/NADH kinase [Acetobacteraceae bacterium]|nr:NAD(+)/NADH kinase [Acetobacteraceae bacterium]